MVLRGLRSGPRASTLGRTQGSHEPNCLSVCAGTWSRTLLNTQKWGNGGELRGKSKRRHPKSTKIKFLPPSGIEAIYFGCELRVVPASHFIIIVLLFLDPSPAINRNLNGGWVLSINFCWAPRPRLRSQSSSLLAGWPWACYFSFLSLGDLTGNIKGLNSRMLKVVLFALMSCGFSLGLALRGVQEKCDKLYFSS